MALLIGALAVAGLWLIRGGAFWRDTLTVFLLMGAAGAAFAYFTGEAMEESAEGTPIVEEIVEFHEWLGLVTLIVSIIAAIASLAVSWGGRNATVRVDAVPVRIALFVVVAAAAVLVAITGHAGGVMVWGVTR